VTLVELPKAARVAESVFDKVGRFGKENGPMAFEATGLIYQLDQMPSKHDSIDRSAYLT
jgi:hypothetical protein